MLTVILIHTILFLITMIIFEIKEQLRVIQDYVFLLVLYIIPIFYLALGQYLAKGT